MVNEPKVRAAEGECATARESTSARDWLAVWSIALSVFVVTTTEMAPVGLLPEIATDLRVSAGTAGLTVTAFGLVAGLLAPLATVSSSRLDRRSALLVILAVFTLGNAISAVSHTYWLLIASRLLTGMIHGLLWSIVATVAIRLVSTRDGVRATAIAFSGISTALVLGVPLGTLLGNVGGWRSVFAVLAGLSGLNLLVVRLLVPRMPAIATMRFTDLGVLLRSRTLVSALVITFLAVVGNYAAYTYISPFLTAGKHVSLSMIGTFLLAYGVAGVFGNFLSGYALHRVARPSTVLIVLGAIVSAALALLLVIDHRAGVVGLLIVWGMAYSGMPVALQTLVLRDSGADGQAATSLYVLVFNCSIAFGALIGGTSIDAGGPAAPILVGTAFSIVSAGATGLLVRAVDR